MKRIYCICLMYLISSSALYSADLVPLPISVDVDDKKVQLGKKLFLDPILSKDNTFSCMSCHNLAHNGADITHHTKGMSGVIGQFNVPTVYNAVYNFRQFWDGRAKDLMDQALQPISNPVEMGNTIENALKSLRANTTYVSMFDSIYDDGITESNLANVLTEFGKALTTPNSPFDKYLRGDKTAISERAIRGYQLFKDKGCISCHNGINIGGNLFNKFGIYEDAKSKELGRYSITEKEEDRYVFKVPSLRNVAITSPYMHDGRATTLKEAVNLMFKYQLGRRIYGKDLQDIVSFLRTLTGELPDIVKDINAQEKE